MLFWTDNLSKYQIFVEMSLSQLSVISCNMKFMGFVFAAHNAPRLAMGL